MSQQIIKLFAEIVMDIFKWRDRSHSFKEYTWTHCSYSAMLYKLVNWHSRLSHHSSYFMCYILSYFYLALHHLFITTYYIIMQLFICYIIFINANNFSFSIYKKRALYFVNSYSILNINQSFNFFLNLSQVKCMCLFGL